MITLDKLIKKEWLKRFNRVKDQNTRRDSLYRYMSVSSGVEAHSSYRIVSYLISSHLISSHNISSHLISSHLISSHLISSHLISSHLISSHLISSHLILSYLILSYLNVTAAIALSLAAYHIYHPSYGTH